jgi:diguanylate cyclase (GGDEF)-like protein/PAS domain S-box-containing protein
VTTTWTVDEPPDRDHDALDLALRALLDQHHDALVAAVNEDGLFVAMPSSVPLRDQAVLSGRSALDVVTPPDRVVVITTWERARRTGAARTPVRLAGEGEHGANLHLLDATARHGVYVAVVVAEEGTASLEQLRSLPLAAPRIARTRKNELAVLAAVDEATTRMLGWQSDEMVGRRSLEFVHPEDQERAIENWMEMLSRPGQGVRVRLRHACHDGSWQWVEVTNHNLLDDPDHGYVLAEMVDISDEMAAQEALREREQLLHRLAEAVPIGLLQVDRERRVVYTNERLTDIVGVGPCAGVDEQLATVAAEDRPAFSSALDAVLEGRDVDIEIRLCPPDGELRHCRALLRSLSDEGGAVTGAIVCLEDVTESVRLRDQLEERATFDVLTRCHNRGATMTALERALARPATTTAVIFVDIDRFKPVNDRFGHTAGDELLRVVAARLQRAVREQDVVGRLGGDEFLVVCPGVGGSDEAMGVADRVRASISGVVRLGDRNVDVRVSLGVACAPAGTTADALVARADAAMYEAKRNRAGTPVLADLLPA